jgi:DICT domain-containing protein
MAAPAPKRVRLSIEVLEDSIMSTLLTDKTTLSAQKTALIEQNTTLHKQVADQAKKIQVLSLHTLITIRLFFRTWRPSAT